MFDRSGIRPRRRGAPVHAAPRALAEGLERRVMLAFGPVGPEFRVNVETAGEQSRPAIAMDADGDFVVAYFNDRAADASPGLLAQRYSAAGAPVGAPILVQAGGIEGTPSVAMDADGDFVVVWFDGASVYGRRYTAAGLSRGDKFRVNHASVLTWNTSVAMDADGDFVVVWMGASRLYGQRFDADGRPVGTEVVLDQGENVAYVSVAMDATGDFVAAWSILGIAIVTRCFDAAGVPRGNEVVAAPNDGTLKRWPTVSADADGDFVVGWHWEPSVGNFQVQARLFAADGNPRGPVLFAAATRETAAPDAAMEADGEFVFTWPGPAPTPAVRAARFAADGTLSGASFQVHTRIPADDSAPVVATDHDGDLVVAWTTLDSSGNLGVAAQRFDQTVDDAAPIVSDVTAGGEHVAPGRQVLIPPSGLVINFSERMSTLGGSGGSDSVTNPANWRLTRNGTDVSSSIRSIGFGYNAGSRKYEAVLDLSPLPPGRYVITARETIWDVAATALDGDFNGFPGGDFALSFTAVNEAPTTLGIASHTVAEEQDVLVNVYDAFSDSSDADGSLTFSVTGTTNPALFEGFRMDRATGMLVLDVAPDASGTSSVTVRATDTAGLFIETTFPVTVLAVNDPPVNTVPPQQFGTPGVPVVFRVRDGNGISVSDIDGGGLPVTVALATQPGYTVELARRDGLVVTVERDGVLVQGLIADVNAALDGMRLVPDRGAAGTTTLAITTTDGGTGVGGPQVDNDTILVTFDERQSGVSIGDVSVVEGNSGFVDATFAVRRSGNLSREAAVSYSTGDGEAREGVDYGASSGRIIFGPEEAQKTVTVRVYGDLRHEANETFFVTLTDPSGLVITDDTGVGTIVNDDAPEPPPTVTQVYVSGTTWSPAFKSYLAAQGLGDARYGYAIPAGAAQFAVLPWGNINQVTVRFSRDVLVLDLDLSVSGAAVPHYPIAAADYDGVDTATWTLARGVRNDKLLLDLDGGPGGITDDSGVLLDGDWANGADAYPSGDGAAGGDFRFRLNVLSGDATRNGRVDILDWTQLRLRQRRSTTTPGGGPTGYGVFHDLNGSGLIDLMDLLYVRRHYTQVLPANEPVAAGMAGVSLTRSLLESTSMNLLASEA